VNNVVIEELRPYCQKCGWRKGGPDSWNGATCKCGHSAPPIERIITPFPEKKDEQPSS